jgi:hypothetical protein
MIRAVLFVLALSAPAAAAPPPKESDSVKLKRVWGDLVDPDKDCSFSLDGDRLRLSVPGKSHLFLASTHNSGRGGADGAPRTAKTVSGDFSLTVTWVQSRPTDDKANAGTFAGVGFYVRGGDACSSVHLHYTADDSGAYASANFILNGCTTNSSTRGTRQAGKDERTSPITMTLTREGNKVHTKYSLDGKKWKPMWTYDGNFPPEVTVGVFAENTGTKGYDALFEGLKIEAGEKK